MIHHAIHVIVICAGSIQIAKWVYAIGLWQYDKEAKRR